MTPNEKLDRFMELKQKVLNNTKEFKDSGYSYYTEKDRDIIMSWSGWDAERVWHIILLRLKYRPFYIQENVIYANETCPFCKYYRSCKDCEYSGIDTVCEESDEILYPLEDLNLMKDLINSIESKTLKEE
jgi:hypothetical protein